MVSVAYPRCGRTMTQYSGIKVAFENSEKDRRTMNSNRLAVCAASLQCTDDEKVVSCLSMAVFGVGRE